MYRFSARLIVLLALATGTAWAQEEERILDEIVAKVNQETITLTDLQDELRLLRISIRDEFTDPASRDQAFEQRKSGLLKTMIQNAVMLQKAEELGLTTDVDRSVDQAIENMRKQMGIPTLETFEQALRQRGTNLQEFRGSLRENMVIQWLIQQSVYSKLTLLTAEVEAYYNSNQDQFTEPAEVELQEIVVLNEGRDQQEARRIAEQALSRLRDGAPFEEVAREVSEGATAARGGAIGTFKTGTLAAATEDVVFELEEGEISGLIETNYGFQIAKVVKKSAPRVRPLEEVRPSVQQILYQRKADPEVKAFVDDLIRQSFIYVKPKYREQYDLDGLVAGD